MPRPGFVLDVDNATPPILFWRGEQVTTERLPRDARVVYGPEALEALPDPDAAIRAALESPGDGSPLRSRLSSDMKLTITVDDISQPLPLMRGPDNRQRVVENVLDLAAEVGVENVHIVIARGLNRRMTDTELRHLLGDRIYESFAPHGLLTHHDAEDADALVNIGESDDGTPLEINARVASSDLVVNVAVNTPSSTTGWPGLSSGLAGYRSVGALPALTAAVATQLNVFQVETTVNTAFLPKPLRFLQGREWEWTPRDRATFIAVKRATDLSSAQLKRKAFHAAKWFQTMTGVFTGSVESAHGRATAKMNEQHVIAVEGQTDVLTLGVPFVGPHSVNSITNPVLMATSALSMVAMHTGTPLVRRGGALIIHHPTKPQFHGVHHPSYVDFFNEVLTSTTDPAEMSNEYDERFANDPWYRHLYRTGNAYHGTHPLHLWRRNAEVLDHLGGVIVVGGETEAVRRLGFKPASTFQDALEMARDVTGVREPSLTHAHTPPTFIADVRA